MYAAASETRRIILDVIHRLQAAGEDKIDLSGLTARVMPSSGPGISPMVLSFLPFSGGPIEF